MDGHDVDGGDAGPPAYILPALSRFPGTIMDGAGRWGTEGTWWVVTRESPQ